MHHLRNVASHNLPFPQPSCWCVILSLGHVISLYLVELRNHIYESVAASNGRTFIRHIKKDCDVTNADEKKALYASLTQVCRQIRSEYTPIQRRSTKLFVRWEEFSDYLRVFHNHQIPQTLQLPEIRIRSPIRRLSSLDILQLLQLRVACPNFSSFFANTPDSSGSWTRTNFKDIELIILYKFLQHDHSQWLEDVRSGVFVGALLHLERNHSTVQLVYDPRHRIRFDSDTKIHRYLDTLGFLGPLYRARECGYYMGFHVTASFLRR